MFQSVAPSFQQEASQLEPFPAPNFQINSGDPVKGVLSLSEPVSIDSGSAARKLMRCSLSATDFSAPLKLASKAAPAPQAVPEATVTTAVAVGEKLMAEIVPDYSSSSVDSSPAAEAPVTDIGVAESPVASPFLKAEELPEEQVFISEPESQNAKDEDYDPFLDEFFQSPNAHVETPTPELGFAAESPPEEAFVAPAVELPQTPDPEQEEVLSDPFAAADLLEEGEGPFVREAPKELVSQNPFEFLVAEQKQEEQPVEETVAEASAIFEVGGEEIFPEYEQNPTPPADVNVTSWQAPAQEDTQRKKVARSNTRLGGIFR